MYTLNGITYKSLNLLYKENKDICAVSNVTLKLRLEGGWSIEKSLTEPKGFMPGKKYYEFESIKYPTLRALYIAIKPRCNTSYTLFEKRIKGGMSIDEARAAPKKKTGKTFIEPQTIEGFTYHTIKEIAEAYTVNFNTMFKRYSRGHRGESLINLTERKDYIKPEKIVKEKRITSKAKQIEFRGRVYRSVKALVEEYGVIQCTYGVRRKRGLTIAQALGLEVSPDRRVDNANSQLYSYRGKKYSIFQLAEIFNISKNTVRDRLKRGATVEQAISKEKLPKGVLKAQRSIARQKTKKNVTEMVVDGVTYQSYSALAKAYEIPYYVVRQRISAAGYTPEEAVKNEGKAQSLVVDGVKFNSLMDAAEFYDVGIATLRLRRSKDWTPRQMVGLDLPPHINVYEWKGKEYSLKELSEITGISNNMFLRRISNGLTTEQAVDMGNDKILSKGRYNLTILERDFELANKPSLLYVICLVVDDKLRYKVGITTTTTVKARMSCENVLWEEVAVGNGTLLECFKMEQAIHDLMDDKNDKTIDGSSISGYTEIFDFDEHDIESIKELISEVLN